MFIAKNVITICKCHIHVQNLAVKFSGVSAVYRLTVRVAAKEGMPEIRVTFSSELVPGSFLKQTCLFGAICTKLHENVIIFLI